MVHQLIEDSFDFLFRTRPALIRKILLDRSRAAAIRAKCLDCMNCSSGEVKHCELRRCPLWGFRMGKGFIDPGIEPPEKPEMSEAKKAAAEASRKRLAALAKEKKGRATSDG